MAGNITYWYDWPSNFSNGTRYVDGLGSFMQYANYSIDGLLGPIILLVVFTLSFLLSAFFGSERAITVSFFVTTFISIFLNRMDLIALPIVIALVTITIAAMLTLFQSNKRI